MKIAAIICFIANLKLNYLKIYYYYSFIFHLIFLVFVHFPKIRLNTITIFSNLECDIHQFANSSTIFVRFFNHIICTGVTIVCNNKYELTSAIGTPV